MVVIFVSALDNLTFKAIKIRIILIKIRIFIWGVIYLQQSRLLAHLGLLTAQLSTNSSVFLCKEHPSHPHHSKVVLILKSHLSHLF